MNNTTLLSRIYGENKLNKIDQLDQWILEIIKESGGATFVLLVNELLTESKAAKLAASTCALGVIDRRIYAMTKKGLIKFDKSRRAWIIHGG